MEIEINQGTLLQMLAEPSTRDEGFRLLMRKYGHTLYWHIRRIVVSHYEAEDALQETCMKILGGLKAFRGDGQLTAWLYRIATNEALRQLKKQTRLFQSINSLGDTLTQRLEAETPLDADSAEVIFQKAILTLPTQQRLAFNLRYYDELSYDDIARITGKSVGSLKTNYHYATEKIRKYIQEHSS